ncbi:MAG TPA: TolC family protein [Longimicrobiales bacterium]
MIAVLVTALFGVAAAGAGALAAQEPVPAAATAASGDTIRLTLESAIARAVSEGQEVRLARSFVDEAEAQVRLVRAEALPQISGTVGYTRTFESAFSGGGGFELPDSLRFEPDSTAPLAERVSYLERNAANAGLGGLGSLFGNLPFGQENAWTATVNGSQSLFSGGKFSAGIRIARELVESARLSLEEETAEVELQVRTAYTRASLAQELVAISQAAVEQATRFLATARLRREAGTASELEVLRAEVSLANLQPQLVEATNAAELATLDLKRLIDLPLEQPLLLTTPLTAPDATADSLATAAEVLANRAVIDAAERQVRIREYEEKVARADYFPSLKLNAAYGRQLFPTSIFSLDEPWRTDFTAGLTLSVPIFNGMRTGANVQIARVNTMRDRLRLAQLREGVQLEWENARSERSRARVSIEARGLTVQQAQRVYDLTVLRYEQGLASQLEVTDARLALLQARTNLAQAVADYHIANARVTRAAGR